MIAIIGIIALIIGLGITILGALREDGITLMVGLLVITLTFIFVGIACNNDASNQEPTTLDVYQGKTTLQITYQDSVPIDTIVVYVVYLNN